MRDAVRRSTLIAAVIAWAMTGATATAYAADASGLISFSDGPKYAIALATVGFLVALLLILRMARRRGGPGDADPAESEPATTTAPASPEAHIPRWRRPSVTAARFGLSSPVAGRSGRRAFADEPSDDQPAERLVVRYDGVPLVDGPDDVHGRTIDELDAGDEVEVVEREDVWIHVRTPAGRSGWVPAMTLAVVGELPSAVWAPAVAAPDPAAAVEPAGPPLEALLEAIVAERRNGTPAHQDEPPEPVPVRKPSTPTKRKAPANATPARPRRKATAPGS